MIKAPQKNINISKGSDKWSSHKSGCKNGSTKTGLAAHFSTGCPGDMGRDKDNLKVTLVDYMDVTMEDVETAKHGGVGCTCSLCEKLKKFRR